MKPASEERGTVLVIEDEAAVREVSRAMLERLGYSTLEAKTGGEAIDLAETYEGDITLALLDIGLPDMTGNEVFQMISKVRPGMKVIVCSGYALEDAAEQILNAGAHSFIQKPYSISHLSGSLSKIMGMDRSRS